MIHLSPSLRAVLPLLALAAAPACVQPVDADADAPGVATRVIAAVDRPSGNRVEFAATDDGELLISESGPNANLPTLPPARAVTVDPVRYYVALTDGATPPDELVALAAVHADERPVDDAPLVLTDGPRPVGGAARSATWFRDHACDKYDGADQEWCLLNRHADSTKSEDDVNGVYAVVMVDEGEVDIDRRLRPWYTWSTSSWTVTAGSWRSWWHSAGIDFDFQSRIRNADGDTYHHAGMDCWAAGACPVFAPLR